MPSRKIPSLHHNLDFQDPMTGGKNVVFHRSHRSKNGRKDFHYIQSDDFWNFVEKKFEKSDEFEEKRWEKLDY